MIARAIYESVAGFLHFEKQLNAVLTPLVS
jgi:hypothetical protein